LKTGDAVVYSNGGGTSIGIQNSDGTTGTLQSGSKYYVIVDPNDSKMVQLAASKSDATATNPIAINVLPVTGSSPLQSLPSAALTNTTTLALAGQPSKYTFDAASAVDCTRTLHAARPISLKTGDAVVYSNGGGTSIGFKRSDGGTGTLQSGGTYY